MEVVFLHPQDTHIYQFYLMIIAADDCSFSVDIILQFFISVLLSIVIISFYILSKRLFLKRKGLSDARVVSIIKNEYGFVVHFL